MRSSVLGRMCGSAKIHVDVQHCVAVGLKQLSRKGGSVKCHVGTLRCNISVADVLYLRMRSNTCLAPCACCIEVVMEQARKHVLLLRMRSNNSCLAPCA